MTLPRSVSCPRNHGRVAFRTSMLVGGEILTGQGTAARITNPATGEVLCSIPQASPLDYGTAWINSHFTLASEMPHGGGRKSGYGREQSRHALDDYTNPRHIMVRL